MADKRESNRSASIDVFKLICALFVVGIHTGLTKQLPENVDFFFTHVLFRVAVPFFCLTTGYFLADRLEFENGKLAKSRRNISCFSRMFKKNAGLYAFWSVVYLIVYIPLWKKIGWLSAWAFVDWGIAAVRTGSYYHLWYLLSLLYALLLLYPLLRMVKQKYWTGLAVVLYAYKACKYGYSFLMPQQIQQVLSAFDVLGGVMTAIDTLIPYLLLGMTARLRNAQGKHSGFAFLICLAALTCEAAWIRNMGADAYSYIFLLMPTAYCFFLWVLRINRCLQGKKYARLAKMSVFVYCVHPAVNAVLENVIVEAGWLRFIAVAGISMLLCCCMDMCKQHVCRPVA